MFSLRSNSASKPIAAKDPQVNTKIDEFPINRSETIIDPRGTITAPLKPIIMAASTLTAVTISKLGAIEYLWLTIRQATATVISRAMMDIFFIVFFMIIY